MTARDILIAAPIDASPEEMERYLEQMCGSDAGLRQEVERLLAMVRDDDSIFPGPAPETDRTIIEGEPLSMERPGDMLGNYKLLETIGEGGFGVVYAAEQVRPVRRRVALKVIKLGMDTREVVARFEAERQALALMDHPCIAKVYDAGATATGRPYFVMELVRGVPITRFCDERKLTTVERLELFAEVCGAVNHAHQRGIIHRDLKPSNVLVTLIEDRPVPKVIDFGIAKATQHKLTDKTLFTSLTQLVGTPTYMAPEQVEHRSQEVDTRSDIYSLGVLLYELLTGKAPFDSGTLLNSGYDELRRIIREQAPPRPSHRLGALEHEEQTSIATTRKSKVEQLTRQIRRDLDWIVMKALEKERVRRYQTANEFAEDIRRYLRNEPVSAAGPSLSYRCRKFARRNRSWLGAASVLVLVGLVGLLLTFRFAAQQREEEANSLLDSLFDCRIERLPAVIAAVEPHAARLDRQLAEAAESPSRPASERARARLALFPRNPAQFSPLAKWLPDAPPRDLGIFLGLLEGREEDLAVIAWSILGDAQASDTSRLPAAAIAAFADPESPRWDSVADRVVGSLVATGVYNSAAWGPMLRPVGSKLSPALMELYTREPDSLTGEMAAHLLADFHSSDSPTLVVLARQAGPRQLAAIAAALGRHPGGQAALQSAFAQEDSESPDASSQAPIEARSRLGIALLLMGHSDPVWPHLSRTADVNLRTELVHNLGPYGVDWRLLEPSLDHDRLPGVIAGTIAALGHYDAAQLPDSVRGESLRARLETLYATHPDPGVRSSAEWLLRQWGLDDQLAALNLVARGSGSTRDRQWYISKFGDFTMAVLPTPADYLMGSSPQELEREYPTEGKRPTDEHQHQETIARTIAVATKEVTYDQFMEFAKELQIPNKNYTPDGWENPVTRTGDAAMSFVSLKEAMLYCWWFTKREGIPDDEQCYEFDGPTFADSTVKTRKGYLLKSGYRILTEAEWEFACRGGTPSARYFGTSDRFLPRYAWYRENIDDHTRPPGLLLPNAFGLFDTLGNISEWCQEPYRSEYSSHPIGEAYEVDERQRDLQAPEGLWHSHRGGSFYHGGEQLRASWRSRTPYSAHPHTGFRIARTVEVP